MVKRSKLRRLGYLLTLPAFFLCAAVFINVDTLRGGGGAELMIAFIILLFAAMTVGSRPALALCLVPFLVAGVRSQLNHYSDVQRSACTVQLQQLDEK